MSHLNTSFDPDYDSFLNLENDYAPTSASPGLNSVQMLTPQSSLPGSSAGFASSSTPQTFPGPSFQYDAYHQQTGIPIGALANTFNINKASGLHYHEGNGGFILPTETLNMPLSNLDEFDFARNPADMDFETESSADLPTMFYPDQASGPSQFVNPDTLVTQARVPRIYPGMHSQQAAQAKAQQAQKQQQHLARQQPPVLPHDQKPLPPAYPPNKAPATKDPLVEESIAKVLNRMRQESVASTADDENTPVGMSNMPRSKKDEDDMDDDEKLLASEEGKKLSSKERRQLRNKVSARAFRSRRKEYISQLEGELNAKAQEANDLRVQNQQLREENGRLTDLTRMLLSSQSFAGFLQELSQSGGPLPTASNSVPPPPKPAPKTASKSAQPVKKDVGTHEAAAHVNGQQTHIGMALIPETPAGLSALQPSSSWLSSLPTNDYHVYAVNALPPPPPTLDLDRLSDKAPSDRKLSKMAEYAPAAPDAAPWYLPPVPETPVAQVDNSVDLDTRQFALYFDSPTAPSLSDADVVPPATLVAEADDRSEENNLARLRHACSALDNVCERLANLAPHMK